MLKKILCVVFALGMVLSIAGCKMEETSSDLESTGSEASSAGTESEQTQSDAETGSDPAQDAESESSQDTEPESSQDAKPESSQDTEPESSQDTKPSQECTHTFSQATCTDAAKCTLCGKVNGKALGHDYSAGKCSRCDAVDQNYATYESGGKDTIIRTTLAGKSTTLKIDIRSANERYTNLSELDPNIKMDISYNNFLEVDGYLYFSQTIKLNYSFSGTTYDVRVDEVYKIKTDGTDQTQIVSYVETSEKVIGVSEVFGFIGNTIYYILENEDEGIRAIHKATLSGSLKNLVTQGTKVADSANEYAIMYNTSIKDGQLHFSEKKYTYNPETHKTEYEELGSYKINTDGTGLTKIS